MAEELIGDRGGIFGLLEFIENHQEALEVELIERGLRLRDLGTERFNWRDLWVIANAPWPGRALATSVHGEAALWTPDTHLLALVVDVLQRANYQRGGGKGQRPKAVPRPADSRGEKMGSEPIPLTQFDSWWENN